LHLDKLPVLSFSLAFFSGYILSLLFFIGRIFSFRRRTFLFILTAALALASPLFIPVQFPVARLLVSTTILIFTFKNWDLYLHPEHKKYFTLKQYAVFLMNHCLFFVNNTDGLINRNSMSSRLHYFLLETIYFFLSILALFVIFRWNWKTYSFWTEHTVKAAASGIWLICAWDWYRAIWSLAGYRTFKFANKLSMAYSPAEFWKRSHCEIHRWLYADVFIPLRGFVHPVSALLLVFAVSGAAHEYMFSISLGYFTGYLLLFFLINGAASAITWRLKLSGIYKYAGTAFTYVFLAISSVFIFIPVNEIIHFYANQIPSWIKLW